MNISEQKNIHISALVALLSSTLLIAPNAAQADFGASCGASTSAFANTMGGAINTNVVQTSNSGSGACSSSPTATVNGQVRINASTALGPTIHTFQQAGTATASGHASVGSLGATVNTAASSTPMSYFYTGGDNLAYATDNNYQASASGNAYAQFWDTLVINQAPGANPWDKVDVRFTLNLHGSESIAGNGWVTAHSSLNVRQGFFGAGGLALFDAGSTSVTLSLDAYTPYTPYTVSLSGLLDLNVNALAGRALGCSVQNIWCTTDPAEFGSYFAESSASGLFGSTASFYIDVLTPGASFTSESGATYLSSVPVPAAAWLFGSGLLGLITVARRKSHCKT